MIRVFNRTTSNTGEIHERARKKQPLVLLLPDKVELDSEYERYQRLRWGSGALLRKKYRTTTGLLNEEVRDICSLSLT
jgi:hypothetical protein